MQLSLQSDYALRILLALAACDRQLSVDDVSRQYGISRNHLAKVAQRLQAEGLVQTFRGRGGGMRLLLRPQDICVGQIVRKFENCSAFVSCFPAASGCVIDGVCGLKPALSGAIEAFLSHLDGYCLADLIPHKDLLRDRLDVVLAQSRGVSEPL